MTRQGVRKRFPAVPPFAPPSSIAIDREARYSRETMAMFREMERRRAAPDPEDEDPVPW